MLEELVVLDDGSLESLVLAGSKFQLIDDVIHCERGGGRRLARVVAIATTDSTPLA